MSRIREQAMEKASASLEPQEQIVEVPRHDATPLTICYGRRETVISAGYRSLDALGFFRRYRRIDWGRVDRLVFACFGNICRSPYAAARAQELGFESASFGIAARTGALANPAAIHIARTMDIALGQHTATHFTDFPFRTGDLIATFEPAHCAWLRKRVVDGPVQMTLLGLWSTPPRPYIPDPYGRTEACFERCYRAIDNALAGIVARLGER